MFKKIIKYFFNSKIEPIIDIYSITEEGNLDIYNTKLDVHNLITFKKPQEPEKREEQVILIY